MRWEHAICGEHAAAAPDRRGVSPSRGARTSRARRRWTEPRTSSSRRSGAQPPDTVSREEGSRARAGAGQIGGTTAIDTWALGAYPLMAERLDEAARAVVVTAGVGAGQRVVDIGTGTGNAAVHAARAGASVVGVDPSAALLRIASERSRRAGLAIEWVAGSAEHVPLADEVVDAVLSVFGAMYAAMAARAAAEMLRVVSPTGVIVLAAWTPTSATTRAARIISAYVAPPPSSEGAPSRWGDPAFLAGLFGGRAEIDSRIRTVRMAFADPRDAATFWVETAGHVQAERSRLLAAGRWRALHDELAELFAAESAAGQLQLEYLESRVVPVA